MRARRRLLCPCVVCLLVHSVLEYQGKACLSTCCLSPGVACRCSLSRVWGQNLVDYSVHTTATVPLKYQSRNIEYYQVNKTSCELSWSTFQSSIALLVNILLPSIMRIRQQLLRHSLFCAHSMSGWLVLLYKQVQSRSSCAGNTNARYVNWSITTPFVLQRNALV